MRPSLSATLLRARGHVVAIAYIGTVEATGEAVDMGSGSTKLVGCVLSDAIGTTEHDSHFAGELCFHLIGSGGKGAAAELEEFVEQVGVLLVGEFHVALFAGHEMDGDFGHIFHHHAAIVRHLELRVVECTFVGFADDRETEGLRGLSALEA